MSYSIRDWCKNQAAHGFPTFCFEEVRKIFCHLPEQAVKNELNRLSRQKVIVSVYKGFYVNIPHHYSVTGIIPPSYYITQLMKHIGKPYYISLLSAAELLGAAHQRSQRFSVFTVFPKTTVSNAKNGELFWSYRKNISSEFLLSKNSETESILYSNAELTSIDLVQYEQYVGGLSRVATVLSELVERTDFSTAFSGLFEITTIPTIQRLGYILEYILEEIEQADTLFEQLISLSKPLSYVPLSTRHKKEGEKDKRWRIIKNYTIEIDEI